MDPREVEYRTRAAIQMRNQAIAELQRQRRIRYQLEPQRQALYHQVWLEHNARNLARARNAHAQNQALLERNANHLALNAIRERLLRIRTRYQALPQILALLDHGIHLPPYVLPWKPASATECVQSPDDGQGYGHEERAKVVCNVLCRHISDLGDTDQGPGFTRFVQRRILLEDPTVPPSPQPLCTLIDSAGVYIRGLPHIWIRAEVHDLDEGTKYFRCWRNRQFLFPLHEADGTVKEDLIWEMVSYYLLFEPLHGRCHACPCELGWGPAELEEYLVTGRIKGK